MAKPQLYPDRLPARFPAGTLTRIDIVASPRHRAAFIRQAVAEKLDRLAKSPPTLDVVTKTLRAHEAELRRSGLLHVSVFGSISRGEAGPGSDIDLLVELDPDARIGAFAYVALQRQLADLFSHPVDIADRASLKAAIRSSVLRDEVRAF